MKSQGHFAHDISAIDPIDRKIIELIQEDPMISHTKIAEIVDRSQPTVGLRVKKLEKSGLLQYQAGANLKKMNLMLAKVDIQCKFPRKIHEMVQTCPYMIHGFHVSGENNFTVIIAGETVRDVHERINYHFRGNPDIVTLSTGFITEVINDFILPIDMTQTSDSCDCNDKNTKRHQRKD